MNFAKHDCVKYVRRKIKMLDHQEISVVYDISYEFHQDNDYNNNGYVPKNDIKSGGEAYDKDLFNLVFLPDVPFQPAEVTWGIILFSSILIINSLVLWIIIKSRELWKPRHLWIAGVCVADLFVGCHVMSISSSFPVVFLLIKNNKCLELILLVWPQRELCVLKRATLGIPYVCNMLILMLLSLDRYVAIRCPFYYSSTISKKHVLFGCLFSIMAGCVLSAMSMFFGLRDPVCRPQRVQLVSLSIILSICSIIIFLFNSCVLRIAKKQLNAINSLNPKNMHTRRLSLSYRNFCRNVSSVPPSPGILDAKNHMIPFAYSCSNDVNPNPTAQPTKVTKAASFRSPSEFDYEYFRENIEKNVMLEETEPEDGEGKAEHPGFNVSWDLKEEEPVYETKSLRNNTFDSLTVRQLGVGHPIFPVQLPLPITIPLTLPLTTPQPVVLPPMQLDIKLGKSDDTVSVLEKAMEPEMTENLAPLTRAISLPAFPKSVLIVINPDPSMPATAKLLSTSASFDDIDISRRQHRSSSITSSCARNEFSSNGKYIGPYTIKVALPRSRSFTYGKQFSSATNSTSVHHPFFRSMHMTRSHGFFHVWKLFPSIRFARTVLLIMLPMWIFLLPIVTIIPMQRKCIQKKAGEYEFECDLLNRLWGYLQIHMRSVLPLQAVLDTLIYAFGSKAFRRCFLKYIRW